MKTCIRYMNMDKHGMFIDVRCTKALGREWYIATSTPEAEAILVPR